MNEKPCLKPASELHELIAEELQKKDKLTLYRGTLVHSLTIALDPAHGAFCFESQSKETLPQIPRSALRHAYTALMTIAALAASCDLLSLNELETALKEDLQRRAKRANLPEDVTEAYMEIIDNFLTVIRNQTTEGSHKVESMLSSLHSRL